MDPSAMKFLELSRFWVQRVLVPILVLIGAGGNVVTVMVLTRRRMRCSTNIYLTALAVADLIYLFFVLILSFEHYPNINDIRYELYWRFYGINHWFADAASSTSIWLTVSFTVERYIAVCHPIRGKVLCTEKRAKRVIAAVSIICILATASTSFEYQLTTSKICAQRTCTDEKITTLRDIESNTDFSIENITLAGDLNITESRNVTDINILDSYVTDIGAETTMIGVTIIESSVTESLLGEVVPSYSNWEEIILNDTHFKFNKDYDYDDRPVFSPFNQMLLEIDKESKSILPFCENKTISYNDTGQNCSESNLCIDQLTNSTGCFENTTARFLEDLENCCILKTIIKTEPTQLGRNSTYRAIFYWFSSVSFAFLPLILISTINCFLVNAVRKSQKERKKMTKSQKNSSQSQENRMTVILISVVMLFLICQTPTACLLIYTSVYPSTDVYADNIVRGLGNVFNLLVSINAACNFLLYCALSDKYRRTFKALFCDKKLKRQDTFAISGRFTSRFSNVRNGPGYKRNASAYLTRSVETQSLTSIPRAKSMISRPLARKEDNIKV